MLFISPGAFFLGSSPPLIWLILTPLERSWLLVFEKIWNLKIQWSDKKLWLTEVYGASINASSRFSLYLGCSNSDFDP